MDRQTLAAEYETRTDDELLRLALTPEELIPEAQEVLQIGLGKRGLSTPHKLAAFKAREQNRKDELERDVKLFSLRGIGRLRYGKADRVVDTEPVSRRFERRCFLFFSIPRCSRLVRMSSSRYLIEPSLFLKRECRSIGSRY